jgi:hypothetical protein
MRCKARGPTARSRSDARRLTAANAAYPSSGGGTLRKIPSSRWRSPMGTDSGRPDRKSCSFFGRNRVTSSVAGNVDRARGGRPIASKFEINRKCGLNSTKAPTEKVSARNRGIVRLSHSSAD